MMAMHYYDAQKHWTKRVLPVLGDPELQFVLQRGLDDYLREKSGREPRRGVLPAELDTCDWRWCGNWGRGRHWPQPRVWAYVCHRACHYVVGFKLLLATLV